MRILYDHQMFSYQKYGGITKYFVELMKNIGVENEFSLSLLFSDNHYLGANHKLFKKYNLLPASNFKGKGRIKEFLALLNHVYSNYYISKGDFDVFHPTFYDSYFLEKLKKPYVITVHDLIEFKFRSTYFKDSPRRGAIEKVIRHADRIISISLNTKNDLLEIFDLDPDKIDVIYHGFNPGDGDVGPNQFGKYILFVGQRSAYKNFDRFVEAIVPLLKKEKDIKLLCVGGEFTVHESSFFSHHGIENQTLAMNVGERSLNNLYAHAMVFVYPSLYEGFGMPILEAFSNGCPICLSNASSFPEIAQNAGEFFDPLDQGSMLDAIEKVIYQKSVADNLRKAGFDRLKDFSWEETARLTLESYKKSF